MQLKKIRHPPTFGLWNLFIICIPYLWASEVALVVKNPPVNAEEIGDPDSTPGLERLLEKGMEITQEFLPGASPWTEEPGSLQSMASQRGQHNWSSLADTHSSLYLLWNFSCHAFQYCILYVKTPRRGFYRHICLQLFMFWNILIAFLFFFHLHETFWDKFSPNWQASINIPFVAGLPGTNFIHFLCLYLCFIFTSLLLFWRCFRVWKSNIQILSVSFKDVIPLFLRFYCIFLPDEMSAISHDFYFFIIIGL